jgi:hypothetical protein
MGNRDLTEATAREDVTRIQEGHGKELRLLVCIQTHKLLISISTIIIYYQILKLLFLGSHID